MCEVSMEFWDEWTCLGPVPVHASCSRLAPLNAVTWLAPAASMSSGNAITDSASAGVAKVSLWSSCMVLEGETSELSETL